jgi:dermatan 4-sulfotransferase 1
MRLRRVAGRTLMIARKAFFRCVLATHPLASEVDRRVDRKWVVQRAALSESGRYCYFRIPKCANSTVVRTLAHYDATVGVAQDDPEVVKTKRRFRSLVHARALTPAQLEARYFLFTVVRNPYTRLLSAFLDKILHADPAGRRNRAVLRAAGVERYSDVPFERFVTYLEEGGLWRNPHWVPQVSMIPVRVSRLKHVGRVESLDIDLAEIIDLIFGGGTFVSLQTKQVARQHADARVGMYYTDDIAARVYALYRNDFDEFGYSEHWKDV